MELKPGLSALVTGGASGIGKIITITFLSTIICENFEFRFQLTSQIIRIQYLLGFISLTDWKLISRFFFFFFKWVQFFLPNSYTVSWCSNRDLIKLSQKKKKKKSRLVNAISVCMKFFECKLISGHRNWVHKFKMIGIRLFIFCENWYIDWHICGTSKQAVWLW